MQMAMPPFSGADNKLCTRTGYGYSTRWLSEHLFCAGLGAGCLIWLECTTLEDRLLSFCKREDGGLVRLISLPEIIESKRGRTDSNPGCLPLVRSADGLLTTWMAWYLITSLCLARKRGERCGCHQGTGFPPQSLSPVDTGGYMGGGGWWNQRAHSSEPRGGTCGQQGWRATWRRGIYSWSEERHMGHPANRPDRSTALLGAVRPIFHPIGCERASATSLHRAVSDSRPGQGPAWCSPVSPHRRVCGEATQECCL